MLNVFQHPDAVTRLTDTVIAATDRAWILKQVQDDGSGWGQ
ncbi:hypothetical protein [Sphingomonas hylomeconis]|uniref:Uncharacterized protein n=1 Tax=Sphingomonas hylomeconis TaxID=1395958 RepID=A0ABV7SPS0_9SPHN|nr:hypothetical protein [Sphingomonas hylomeconis]